METSREKALWLAFILTFPVPHGTSAPPTVDESARVEEQTHIFGPCWTNLSEDRLVNGVPGSSGYNYMGLCLTGLASQAGLVCACASDKA